MLHHMVEGWNGSTVLCKVHKAFTTMVRGLIQGGFIVGYAYTYIYLLVSYLPDRLIFIAFQSTIPSLYAVSLHLWLLCILYYFFPFFFFKNRPYTDHIHTHNSTSPLYYYVNALYYRDNLSVERNTYFFFTKILRKKFLRFTTFSYKL